MKLIYFTFAFLINVVCLKAQNVVEWEYSIKKIADQTYQLHIKAKIQDEWHIYSRETPAGGPVPTTIQFNKNPVITLSGKIVEQGEREEYFEPVFGTDVYSYSGTVEFIQNFKLASNIKTNIAGVIEFMACTKNRCLSPQKQNFKVFIQ